MMVIDSYDEWLIPDTVFEDEAVLWCVECQTASTVGSAGDVCESCGLSVLEFVE